MPIVECMQDLRNSTGVFAVHSGGLMVVLTLRFLPGVSRQDQDNFLSRAREIGAVSARLVKPDSSSPKTRRVGIVQVPNEDVALRIRKLLESSSLVERHGMAAERQLIR